MALSSSEGKWMFPKIMVPQKWLVWKTLLKWMIWGYHYFWKHLNDIGRLSPLDFFLLFFWFSYCCSSIFGVSCHFWDRNTEVKGVVKRNEAVQRVCRDVT